MRIGLLLGFTLALVTAGFAQDGKKDKDAPAVKDQVGLVVIDKDGTEHKVKNWKASLGTRVLNFNPLPLKKGEPAKVPQGPAYLEFREDNSTTYANGIVTLIPLESVRKLDYDNEKKTVAVTLAQADGKDAVLTGTTKYVGINKLTIEGDADLGNLGSATLKYQGGLATHPKAVRSFRFAEARPTPEPMGPTAVIVSVEKDKAQHKAQDLKALYRVSGGYRLSNTLMFKKTVKIDLGQIAKLRHIEPEDKKVQSNDFEVTLADGKQHNLTLLSDINLEDNASAQLVGLFGKVPAGYRLFPPHVIGELKMEGAK